jgi:hypothetical protein
VKYPRNEIVATLDGLEFQAEAVAPDGTVTLFQKGGEPPPDPRFSYDKEWDLWEVTLPISACGSLVEIHAFARYRGIPCQVISVDDTGQAVLYYVGHAAYEAEKFGFEQTDPGTYSNAVDIGELFDYHEIHSDLLFDHWRQTTFPKPGGEGPA